MRLFIRCPFLIGILLLLNGSVLGQEWLRKILPLETTVTEVEQTFREKPEKRADKLFFKLKEGNVFVYFSVGCSDGTFQEKWAVEENKITRLIFYPKRKKNISFYRKFISHKIEAQKMRKASDSGHTLYIDDEKGVIYDTQFGKVLSVEFFPPKNYDDLKCKSE